MIMSLLKTIQTRITGWKKSVNGRKLRLIRFIEYKRLKRIRNHKSPQYTFCKNCGEKLLGMYCHKCGQYALDVDQTFFMYIRQFFENAYQFDGKAIQTVQNLFIHPGFLSKEFIAGKINSYVHPLKLYMFASIIFFSFVLVIYSQDRYADRLVEIVAAKNSNADSRTDSIQKKQLVDNLTMKSDTLNYLPYTFKYSLDTLKYPNSATLKYLSDTLKRTSDASEGKNSWKKKAKGLYQDVFTRSSKNLPFLLLALLPIFAFLLRLLFRKTHRAYMSNFVFSVHIHTMFLIMLTLAILVNVLSGVVSVYLYMLILFGIYLLLAVRGFYQNNWIKTILKTGIASFLYICISVIATAILLIMTLVQASENVG